MPNTNPPPPMSGQTQPQSTTQTSSGKIGIGQYFESTWLPAHITQLVTGILGVALAFLGPAAVVALGGENNIFEVAAATVAASVALELPDLSQDIASKDVEGFEVALCNIAYNTAGMLIDEEQGAYRIIDPMLRTLLLTTRMT